MQRLKSKSLLQSNSLNSVIFALDEPPPRQSAAPSSTTCLLVYKNCEDTAHTKFSIQVEKELRGAFVRRKIGKLIGEMRRPGGARRRQP